MAGIFANGTQLKVDTYNAADPPALTDEAFFVAALC
jgi:hypothetical protein